MPRALLHIHRASNLGAALPLAHGLRHSQPWEAAVYLTPYDPEERVGLAESPLARIRKIGLPIIENPQEWKPDVTFTFEPVESKLDGCGLLARIPSGTRGRGERFTTKPAGNLDNLADLLFVPGPWHGERLQKGGKIFTPIITVGLPSLDPILGNWIPKREVFCNQLRLDPNRRIILFAPSYEPEYSAIPILWTRISAIADDDNLLFIRLHPDTPEEARDAFEELAKRHPHVMITREMDIQPYLRLANLVITDVSTIMFEAAALNLPVILFDNPNQREHPRFDATDPEFSFRQLFPRVSDLKGLRLELERFKKTPRANDEINQQIRKGLFKNLDGTSIQHIFAATIQALNQRASGAGQQPLLTTLIPVEAGDEEHAMNTLKSLFEEGGLQLKAVVATLPGTTTPDKRSMAELAKRWPERVTLLENASTDELQKHLFSTPFNAVIHPGITGHHRWLLRLLNHLRRMPDLDGIVPLMPAAAPGQDPRVLLNLSIHHGDDLKKLDEEMMVSQSGITWRTITPPRLDIIVMSKGSPALEPTLNELIGTPSGLTTVKLGVAADVVLGHPHWHDGPLWNRVMPLNRREIAEAERRIKELSQWIGRLMPQNGNVKSSVPENTNKSVTQTNSDTDGLLRLALHYEKKGKFEKAAGHLQKYLGQHPGDKEALELARRLGATLAKANQTEEG